MYHADTELSIAIDKLSGTPSPPEIQSSYKMPIKYPVISPKMLLHLRKLWKMDVLIKLVFCVMLGVAVLSENCVEEGCGASKSNVVSRIADGEPSERNSRPFQVALYKRVGTTGEQGFCGGVLVHPEWVLTAAHCCFHQEQAVDNIQAILGAHSLYDRYENGRRIVNVVEIVIHPGWVASTFANDLALLRLANAVQITDTIDVARLPYQNMTSFNFAGMAAIASGWGIPAEGVSFVSPTLREKTMTVTTDTLCNTYYQQQLPANTICGFHASAGTCKGDNGGPMTVYNNPTEEDIVVGVASFVGAGGCTSGMPSVFTRVQRYSQWIADTTGLQLL